MYSDSTSDSVETLEFKNYHKIHTKKKCFDVYTFKSETREKKIYTCYFNVRSRKILKSACFEDVMQKVLANAGQTSENMTDDEDLEDIDIEPFGAFEGQEYTDALELMRRQGVNVGMLANQINLGGRNPEPAPERPTPTIQDTNVMSVLDRIRGQNGEEIQIHADAPDPDEPDHEHANYALERLSDQYLFDYQNDLFIFGTSRQNIVIIQNAFNKSELRFERYHLPPLMKFKFI